MTQEEARKRFAHAVQRKKEVLAELEKSMKASYEAETGQKANYFFAM